MADALAVLRCSKAACSMRKPIIQKGAFRSKSGKGMGLTRRAGSASRGGSVGEAGSVERASASMPPGIRCHGMAIGKGKHFFFEKKKQKTFVSSPLPQMRHAGDDSYVLKSKVF
jgi:hypothetical protein